uniref:ATP synthase complex subunit 8 n=1 Tax=Callionymus enneactis TaxID=1147745 RepID=A0A060NQG5_9TELE|nr:ATP synthase F0 subunit 8 [Callionymus enneactis]BAO84801.1 ATPase subunit 8 [Callionymus enneactis]
MPQLNPAPWFPIMVFSWLAFLMFLPPKVMSREYLNNLVSETKETMTKNPWNWPW